MCKYVIAFSLAFAITPASALDLGVSVGGVDVGGSVSVDRDGASVGIGAGVGGVADVDAGASVGTDQGGVSVGVGGQVGGVGVNAGASVGTGGTSVGASVGTGNNSVGVGAGTNGGLGGTSGPKGTAATKGTAASKGTAAAKGTAGMAKGTSSVGATTGSTAGKTSKQSAATSPSSGPAATTVGVVPTKGVQQSLSLPRILLPQGGSDRASAVSVLEAVPGTPDAVVRACREAVETAAVPYGAINVSAKSSGSVRRLNGGLVSAPIHVRIKYQRQGGPEVRQARIKCRLDAAGKVVKLT